MRIVLARGQRGVLGGLHHSNNFDSPIVPDKRILDRDPINRIEPFVGRIISTSCGKSRKLPS